MKSIKLNEAVAKIPNGATLMIGGFMAVGTPERLMDELVRQNRKGLTAIASDFGFSYDPSRPTADETKGLGADYQHCFGPRAAGGT
jgi:acyl CoA:acetate/3-ketoacid CoA transferase